MKKLNTHAISVLIEGALSVILKYSGGRSLPMNEDNDVIETIDGALHDFEMSRDAMRWSPDPVEVEDIIKPIQYPTDLPFSIVTDERIPDNVIVFIDWPTYLRSITTPTIDEIVEEYREWIQNVRST